MKQLKVIFLILVTLILSIQSKAQNKISSENDYLKITRYLSRVEIKNTQGHTVKILLQNLSKDTVIVGAFKTVHLKQKFNSKFIGASTIINRRQAAWLYLITIPKIHYIQ